MDCKKFKRVEKCLDKAKKYMKRLNDPGLDSNYKSTLGRYNSMD